MASTSIRKLRNNVSFVLQSVLARNNFPPRYSYVYSLVDVGHVPFTIFATQFGGPFQKGREIRLCIGNNQVTVVLSVGLSRNTVYFWKSNVPVR